MRVFHCTNKYVVRRNGAEKNRMKQIKKFLGEDPHAPLYDVANAQTKSIPTYFVQVHHNETNSLSLWHSVAAISKIVGF